MHGPSSLQGYLQCPKAGLPAWSHAHEAKCTYWELLPFYNSFYRANWKNINQNKKRKKTKLGHFNAPSISRPTLTFAKCEIKVKEEKTITTTTTTTGENWQTKMELVGWQFCCVVVLEQCLLAVGVGFWCIPNMRYFSICPMSGLMSLLCRI